MSASKLWPAHRYPFRTAMPRTSYWLTKLAVLDQGSCGWVICLGVVLFCGGCNRIPPLTEYANEPTTLREVLSSTPAIVVGTIAGRQSFVGPYRQSRWVWDREWTVQLVRVPFDVETVLGSDQKIPTGKLDIYYHLWNVQIYSGPPRLGSWQVGDRFIFFLRRESGYFRTICDEYKGCAAIPVFSGATGEANRSSCRFDHRHSCQPRPRRDRRADGKVNWSSRPRGERRSRVCGQEPAVSDEERVATNCGSSVYRTQMAPVRLRSAPLE